MNRFLLLSFLIFGCQNLSVNNEEFPILATIGDRTITERDFKNRSEYTIRPAYCKGNLYYHKKIILNNLIAEKLLALEAQKLELSPGTKALNNFIKGRKEQAMRQLLFHKEGFLKVDLTKDEINHYFKMAGRKYDISYFSFPGGEFADSVNSAIYNGLSLDQIYTSAFNGKMPRKDVLWTDSNDELINSKLFTSPQVEKGQIMGPMKMNDGSGFIMKINGWNDSMPLSQKSIDERIETVTNTLKERKAIVIFSEFISETMKGKSIQLNKEIFPKYAESIGKKYFTGKEDKESALSKALFGDTEILQIDNLKPRDEEFEDLPLFDINGEIWTVKKFEKELSSHPLVFRKRKMSNEEFPNQFRLAIVDFIQDYYLTKRAYEMDLDIDKSILLNEQLWSDSFFAFQYAIAKLEGISSFENKHTELKPYIDELQSKYNSIINIDMDLFEKITISNIDMFATQGNVPYPVIVPSFPSFTDDSYIDYGSLINK